MPRPATRNISGYDDVLRRHGVEFERLDATEIVDRWPQFELTGSEQGIYQAESGIVDAGKANATHIALARAAGATIRDNTPVLHVRPARAARRGRHRRGDLPRREGRDHRRRLDEHRPRRPGPSASPDGDPGTGHLLRDPVPARVLARAVPVFMWHGEHNFYGFPVYGEVATKLGQHNGGYRTTAQSRTFAPDPVRERRQFDFLAAHLPRFVGPTLYTKTCLYTPAAGPALRPGHAAPTSRTSRSRSAPGTPTSSRASSVRC